MLFLLAVVAWSYYALVVELVAHRTGSESAQAGLLVAYHIVLVLFLWAFAQTIATPPGGVPDSFRLTETQERDLADAKSEADWKAMLERMVEAIAKAEECAVRQRSVQGAPRFCEKCHVVKPDRAHHCSVCETCVLKMDHHCPWVNNCVGFGNYKFFCQFVTYGYAYCLTLMCSMAEYVYTAVVVRTWAEGLRAAAAAKVDATATTTDVFETGAAAVDIDEETTDPVFVISLHIVMIFVIATLFFLFLSSLFW